MGWGLTLSGDVFTPLPVELTTFTAATADNKVVLNWETATEVNNYGFEIDRAMNNEQLTMNNWETIGFVKGHGNSNSLKKYKFIDQFPFIVPADTIQYRSKQIDTDGAFEYYGTIITIDVSQFITSIDDKSTDAIPTEYELAQNYPNPFNPSTVIKVATPESGKFTLNVFNILGQKVATLFSGELTTGYYSFDFNASNIATGIYIYSFQGKNIRIVKKMNLMK